MSLKILLSPAAAVETEIGGGGVAGGPPKSLAGWMANIGPNPGNDAIEPGDPAKQPENKDGKTNTEGRSGADKRGSTTPVAKPADAPAPAVQPAPGEPKPGAAAATEPEGEDKFPRNTSDWDKFKANRAKREAELRAENAAALTQVKELEAKIKAAEDAVAKARNIEPDPAYADENKSLKEEIKMLNDRIIELDVTQHPKFQSYFKTKTDEAIARAKEIVGEDRAPVIEKILSLPNGEFKNVQIKAFIEELEVYEGGQLSVVIQELKRLDRERDDEVKKAGSRKETIVKEREDKAKAAKAQFDRAFQNTVAEMQDEKNGSVIYQKRSGEGSKEWNEAVDARIEEARRIISGSNLGPADISKIALNAVAYPVMLQSFGQAVNDWKEKEAKYEAQIKELTAAVPANRGTTSTAPREAGPIKSQDPNLDHVQRSKAWTREMGELMQKMSAQDS